MEPELKDSLGHLPMASVRDRRYYIQVQVIPHFVYF